MEDVVGCIEHEEIVARASMIKFVCSNPDVGTLITINNKTVGKEFSTPLFKLCKTKKIINVKIHIEDDHLVSHD
jgi:hypothetical protein